MPPYSEERRVKLDALRDKLRSELDRLDELNAKISVGNFVDYSMPPELIVKAMAAADPDEDLTHEQFEREWDRDKHQEKVADEANVSKRTHEQRQKCIDRIDALRLELRELEREELSSHEDVRVVEREEADFRA